MPSLFAGTLFLSALLLFCVQPLIAKMILPLLGGSPAVWNTCMVFFQAALLAGYLYAHAVTTWLSARAQVIVHLVVLAVPLVVLPISEAQGLQFIGLPDDTHPVWWLLRLLIVVVGLPFFVVATSAPLLQKWFAGSGHPSAADPYFLYAASNLGSMAALLGYPFLLEPFLRLADQSGLWTGGYVVLIVLTGCCGLVAWRALPVGATPEKPVEQEMPSAPAKIETPALSKAQRWRKARQSTEPVPLPSLASEPEPPALEPSVAPLTVGRRCRWVALAFFPSSLMLAVTSYITTDVAAIPLLWVVPLAVYLLSFILVFARRPLLPHAWMLAALPIATLVVMFTFLTDVAMLRWYMIPLHWLVLFLVAMTCHGELARDRPAPRYLTEFYLWMSVGGVLGGSFTALLAPLLFSSGIIEYPLLVVLSCMMRSGPGLWKASSMQRWLELLVPLGFIALTLAMVIALRRVQDLPTLTGRAVVLGILVFGCVLLVDRPIRFSLSTLGVFLTFAVANPTGTHTRFVERNFFGVVRVYDEARGRFRILAHGSTTHGLQKLTADGRPDPLPEPLSYFTPTGPIGQVFDLFNARTAEGASGPALPPRVAITGLGVGAMASYARPNQFWTYYEIDPAIVRVAEPEAGLFTYLAACRTQELKIVLGDARLQLQKAPDHGYGLIIMDAFSSDAVPMHLISQEALELYLAKLAPGGLVVFNISNRYLDLKPVLGNLAGAAQLVCYARDDVELTSEEIDAGKNASQWLIMARRVDDLGSLARDSNWKRVERQPGVRVWTDGFSNILEVVKWR